MSAKSPCAGVSVQGGLCLGSLLGISVHVGLCSEVCVQVGSLWGSLSGGSLSRVLCLGDLCPGVSVQGDPRIETFWYVKVRILLECILVIHCYCLQ